MLVSGVNHISFAVRDLERSRAFYEGVLGLETIPRPDFGIPGAWYQAGDVQLHLIVPPDGVEVDAPPEKLTPLAGHLAFQVESYNDVCSALEAEGIAVLPTHEKVGQLFVQDPDGHVIELIVPGGQLGRR